MQVRLIPRRIASLILATISTTSLLASSVSAQDRLTRSDLPSIPACNSITFKVESTSASVRLSPSAIALTPDTIGNSWRVEGEGSLEIEGRPVLPAVSRWVVVPPSGRISLRLEGVQTTRLKGEAPDICTPEVEGGSPTAFALPPLHGVWPQEAVVISEPKVWRGVRLVNVVIHPLRWDAESHEYIRTEIGAIEIRSEGGIGLNEVEAIPRRPCGDFRRALEALVVNPPERDDPDEFDPPGSYLVVANHNPPAALNEFIEAKRKFGHPVELLLFDPVQETPGTIKELIQQQYNRSGFTDLVLIGNEAANEPFRMPYLDSYYDLYYGQLEGDDEIPDVAVGSFNCMNEANFTCAVRRSIAYQYDPDMRNGAPWLGKAFVGVGHCSVPGDLSPSYTGKWIQEVLERRGFQVASTFYADRQVNEFSPQVAQQYNNGVNLVIVRGHEFDLDTSRFEATTTYPFHFLVSSVTIDDGGRGAFNYAFRMGTPENMKGPSAGFGFYFHPRTNAANGIVGGLTEALFFKDIRSFGWARNYLNLNLYRLFPADQEFFFTDHWGWLRYYGDPGQEAWLDGIHTLRGQVLPDELDIRSTAYPYTLLFDPEFDPEALHPFMNFYQPGHLLLSQPYRSESAFVIPADELGPNTAYVSFTSQNYRPELLPVRIVQRQILQITGIGVAEQNGNGDGEINPGEAFVPTIRVANLTNRATTEGTKIRMVVNSEWGHGWMTGSELPVLQENEVSQDIVLRLGENDQQPNVFRGCRDGEQIDLFVMLDAGQGDTIGFGGMSFTVAAPKMVTGLSLDAPPTPENEAVVSVLFRNQGNSDALNLRCSLVSLAPYAEVVEGITDFDGLAVGADPIVWETARLQVTGSAIPGSHIPLRLIVTGDPGVVDTSFFEGIVGGNGAGKPTGPDKYGYIALNDGDENTVWADAPVFNWLNCSPWGGDLQGRVLDFPPNGETDSSVVVDLPFRFRYYGQEFRQITICNNGWLAMGDQHRLKNQQNWPLPGPNGAFGMVAPFWDRLEMLNRSDGVFIYYDEVQRRYIIQWQTGTRMNGNWAGNAFEVILFDPERYPTPTGDSQILFQYQQVNNIQDQGEANAKCTVGIQSPDCQDGMTYTYWGEYPAGAGILQARRAILWTTVDWDQVRVPLYGRMVKWIDSTAVEGATVTVGNSSGVTDAEGRYRLLVPAGVDFVAVASCQRYRSAEIRAPEGGIVDDDSLEINFVLPHGWVQSYTDTCAYWMLGRDRTTYGAVELGNFGNRTARCWLELVIPDSGQWAPGLEVVIRYGEENESFLSMEAFDTTGWIQVAVVDYHENAHSTANLIVHSDTPSPNQVLSLDIVIESATPTEGRIPLTFGIRSVNPNPFNSAASVSFDLEYAGRVDVEVFDIAGRRVATLASGYLSAGRHSVHWDGSGSGAGIYFVRLRSGGKAATSKMLLVK